MSTDPRQQGGMGQDDSGMTEDPSLQPETPETPDPDDDPLMNEDEGGETEMDDQTSPLDRPKE